MCTLCSPPPDLLEPAKPHERPGEEEVQETLSGVSTSGLDSCIWAQALLCCLVPALHDLTPPLPAPCHGLACSDGRA